MFTYAVVRKPPSDHKQVQQVLKYSPQNHLITIDSIDLNRSQQIRKDSGEKESHLIFNRGQHHKISTASKSPDLNRTSLSNSKRYKIFEQRTSVQKKQKMFDSIRSEQLSRQSRLKDSPATPIVEDFAPRTQIKQQQQKPKELNFLSESPVTERQKSEQNSSFVKIANTYPINKQNTCNQSFSHSRNYRIFQKKQRTPLFATNSSRTKQQGAETIKNNRVPLQIQNQFRPLRPISQKAQPPFYPYNTQTSSQRSASMIVIGCCGVCEETPDYSERSSLSGYTWHDRQPVNTRTIIHRNFNITQSISQRYNPPLCPRTNHRPIFENFSDKVFSKSLKQQLAYPLKQQKTSQKPVRDTDVSPPRQKQKVTVYTIKPFEPIQF